MILIAVCTISRKINPLRYAMAPQSTTRAQPVIIVLLGCLIVGVLASSHAPAARAVAAQDQERPAGAAEIQPGELLVISLDGLMGVGLETRLTRRVGEEGEIWLPLLDEQPLSTRNLTPGQLQSEIRRAYMRKSVRTEIVAVARVDKGEDQQLIAPQADLVLPAGR